MTIRGAGLRPKLAVFDFGRVNPKSEMFHFEGANAMLSEYVTYPFAHQRHGILLFFSYDSLEISLIKHSLPITLNRLGVFPIAMGYVITPANEFKVAGAGDDTVHKRVFVSKTEY